MSDDETDPPDNLKKRSREEQRAKKRLDEERRTKKRLDEERRTKKRLDEQRRTHERLLKEQRAEQLRQVQRAAMAREREAASRTLRLTATQLAELSDITEELRLKREETRASRLAGWLPILALVSTLLAGVLTGLQAAAVEPALVIIPAVLTLIAVVAGALLARTARSREDARVERPVLDQAFSQITKDRQVIRQFSPEPDHDQVAAS